MTISNTTADSYLKMTKWLYLHISRWQRKKVYTS